MTDRSRTEQAVGWFLQLQGEPFSADERAAFERWLTVQENARAFSRVQDTWHAVEWVADDPIIASERARVVRCSGTARRWRPLATAASVATILCGGIVLALGQPWSFPEPKGVLTEQATAGEFIGTRIGERSSVTLADGSTVILNTDSAIRIAYSSKERRIVLERGQAFFAVAKHQPQPFTVYTGGQRILATGTAFDVRLDPLGMQVVLVEGEVRVAGVDGQGSLPVVLLPGQKLVAHVGTPPVISTVDIEQATSWASGRVIFQDTPLSTAVEEINRYSDRKLVVTNAAIGALPVSGVFFTAQPARFARAIAEIYPLSLRDEPSGRILIEAQGR